MSTNHIVSQPLIILMEYESRVSVRFHLTRKQRKVLKRGFIKQKIMHKTGNVEVTSFSLS